jgi:hypothetical protein
LSSLLFDQLTDAARTALEDTDFGSANVPFKEANFERATRLGLSARLEE